MTNYKRGDIVTLTASWEDGGGTATDPSDQTLYIYNSASTLKTSITSAGMTTTATGTWHYDYQSSSAETVFGLWTIVWVGTVSGEQQVIVDHFGIEDWEMV